MVLMVPFGIIVQEICTVRPGWVPVRPWLPVPGLLNTLMVVVMVMVVRVLLLHWCWVHIWNMHCRSLYIWRLLWLSLKRHGLIVPVRGIVLLLWMLTYLSILTTTLRYRMTFSMSSIRIVLFVGSMY